MAIAIAGGFALTATAHAQEYYDDGTHWTRPSDEILAGRWPHDAQNHLVYGQVKLDCGVGTDNFATDCKILLAAPSDRSVVAAATELARLFKARDRSFRRAVIDIDLRNDEPAQITAAPPTADFNAAYPAKARARNVHGAATVECTASADGHLSDCSILNEYPRGFDIGAAISALVPKATVKPATRLGQAVDSKIVLTYGWLAADGTYGPPPKNDTNPDWLRKPTFDQMMAVFPSKAGGRGGQAVIRCIVKIDGLLRACGVIKEKPEKLGFGPAALLLAPTFLMKPALLDGQPVEAEVTIPINFDETSPSNTGGPSITVVTTPPWAKTPTVTEILSELDKKVGDKFADGKVTFQCTVSKKSGHLSDCITVSTSPGMTGFAGAARALTAKFEVSKDVLAQAKQEVRVNLAFSFPDMQSEAWSKRYLLHPVWLKTVSPDPNQPLFPEEAEKAGLKTGKATVDCVLAPDGALTRCEVVSESTPGVGFGTLAIKIAQVFVANPWTEDGLPADGAHVRMPIQMNYEPPAETPPGSPAPTPATKP